MGKVSAELIIGFVFMVAFSGTGIGQVSNINSVGGEPIMTKKYEDIVGSPYLGDGNWFLGSMTDVDGAKIENAQLRFNAYDNELEFHNSGKPLIVSKKDIVAFDLILIESTGNTTMMNFKNGIKISDKVTEDDYVRVIYEGEDLLLVQKFEKDQIKVTPASYGENDYTKFVESSKFYLDSSDFSEEIKLNKKSFMKLLPSRKDEIKDYLSSHDIDFNNMNDVKDFLQFLDDAVS